MRKIRTGGGFPAIQYALRMARGSGGLLRFFKAMRSKNACKTCALGMGGQAGGMVDESGRFPEVCKKSMQAMAADMQGEISEEFFAKHDIAAMQKFSPRELEMMGRITQPLLASAGDDRYRAISWDEAIERATSALTGVQPDESFFYVSGRSSNEAAFLIQLFARLYGTNNVNNCSYYCHQASGVGIGSSLGTGTATIDLEDLSRCDLLFLIGGNPASNHPRLMRQLMKLRRRGGDVIVVNPLKETGLVNFSVPSDVRSLLFGSSIASDYVQPHIGGDIALLCGIAKRVIELGATASGFIHAATEQGDVFIKYVESLDWADIGNASGVDAAAIDRVARRYAESTNTVFAWTMGITHHVHGTDNIRAIINLALLRGMIGKPGAGLLPIRGHSNVQGIGSVGVTPALKQAVFDAIESRFGVTLPTTPGLDTLACMEAMDTGKLKTGWCLGGNLFGSNPDATFARDALGKLDSLVYFSTTLNTGHAFGRAKETLILPVLARDEEPQPTTQESMFNFVRLSEGGPARHDGPRSEVEIIATIAQAVLGDDGPIDWRSMQQYRTIREAIAAIVPGYDALAEIDDSKREFQLSGRTFHTPKFATPSGKARFHITPIPAIDRGVDSLLLMTIRSEGQFNTVVYEEHDLYRNQDHRDIILMSEADMKHRGLNENDRVTVRSTAGEMRNILVRSFDIRAGNVAMYFPEANVLVPTDADPESRTPAYKAVPVTIVAQVGDISSIASIATGR
jgi:molybdopterin-dependent oxidoreductase alpha subunit